MRHAIDTVRASKDLDCLNNLATTLQATITWIPEDSPEGPVSRPDLHRAWLIPPDGVFGYWSGLHELGHIADQPRPRDEVAAMLDIYTAGDLEKEARAWNWGLEHSWRPLDADGRDNAANALGTYLTAYLQTSSWAGLSRTSTPALAQLASTLGAIPYDSDTQRWFVANMGLAAEGFRRNWDNLSLALAA